MSRRLILFLFLFFMMMNNSNSHEDEIISKISRPRKLFTNFVNILKQHFDTNHPSYVNNIENYTYSSQLLLAIDQYTDGLLFIDDFDRFNDIGNANLLSYEFTKSLNILENFNPKMNVLILIDINESVGNIINCRDYIEMNKPPVDKFWSLFRSVIFCNKNDDYELWIQAPWSPFAERIEKLSKAYFNQKPNLRRSPIAIHSLTWFYKLPESLTGMVVPIAETIIERLNATLNFTTLSTVLIANEPLTRRPHHIYDAYKLETLCIVVHKSGFIPKWQAINRCFSFTIWLSLIGICILTSIVWYKIKFDQNTLTKSILEICGLYVTYPVSWLHSTELNRSRILTGMIILMSNVLIVGLFQSKLYSNLQDLGRYPPIDTINDLIEANISIICKHDSTCLFWFDQYFRSASDYFILEQLEKQWLYYINEHGRFFFKITEIKDILNDSKVGLIYSCDEANSLFNSLQKYKENLHIMKETVSMGFWAIGGGSFQAPFYDTVRQIFHVYLESGIAGWKEHLYQWNLVMKDLMKEHSTDSLKVFTLEDLQLPFYILILGNFLAFLIFLLERKYPASRKFEIGV